MEGNQSLLCNYNSLHNSRSTSSTDWRVPLMLTVSGLLLRLATRVIVAVHSTTRVLCSTEYYGRVRKKKTLQRNWCRCARGNGTPRQTTRLSTHHIENLKWHITQVAWNKGLQVAHFLFPIDSPVTDVWRGDCSNILSLNRFCSIILHIISRYARCSKTRRRMTAMKVVLSQNQHCYVEQHCHFQENRGWQLDWPSQWWIRQS